MHISIIAVDFDGTISQGDRLSPEAARVLHRWRENGQFTVLVSGRPFEFLHDLEKREQAFDLIVAENGAVLYNPRTDEMRLPFGKVPAGLLDTLVKLDVPLWRGIAIAGTTTHYDDAVWVASRELDLAVHVATNRGEVMLLPPGASKGAGVLNILASEGLSSRNLVAFGDAENDRSLLQIAEVKVAVANAVEGLKAIADHVTSEAGPAGVAAFIEHYLLDGRAFDFAVRGAHYFDLGAAGEIRLNAHDLVDRNVLIVGGSGSGKSWLASRLADGLIDGGYQLLALDPVGDLRALRRQATCLCLGGEEIPSMGLIVQLLAETDLSLALDLSRMHTPEEQILYMTGLMRRVLGVRQRFGKPHWILVDEAQDLLGGLDNPARLPLLQSLNGPGVCLVVWQPGRLDSALLHQMDGFLLTQHRLSREIECLSHLLANKGLDVTGLAERLGELGEGQVLAWGMISSQADALVPLRVSGGSRVFSEMYHPYQYLEKRVDRSRRFYFRDPAGQTVPAGNLGELIDRMHTLDLEVITFHFQRRDYSRWIRDVLHDETLARWVDRLQAADLSGESLRRALIEVFEQRYRVLARLV